MIETKPTPTPAARPTGDQPRLSVIIPMYQEQARIGKTLGDLVPWLEAQPWASEVLLVNDGSKDQTEAAVAAWVRDGDGGGSDGCGGSLQRVRLLRHVQNQGKGAAVRTGLSHARGQWTLMMDADNAATIREVGKLFDRAEHANAAFVVGSRVSKDSEVKTSASRGLVRLVYISILKSLGLAPVSDTQCGFKLYRADLARRVAERARERGFVFDIEHLLIARQGGFQIAEVGIKWEHQEGGTVNPVRDGLRMLARAFAIRWRALTERGKPAAPAAPVVELKPMPGGGLAIEEIGQAVGVASLGSASRA